MADLTPEMLAQLEKDFGGVRVIADGNEIVMSADVIDGHTHTRRWTMGHEVAAPLARLIIAVPSLVAAARERDQLRADVACHDGIAHEFDLASTRADALCLEVGTLRAELDDVRRAVDAPGDSGTFEAVARLHDEVTRLRNKLENQGHALFVADIEHKKMQAEITSLRAPVLPVSEAAETMVGGMMAEARAAMHDEIERKP